MSRPPTTSAFSDEKSDVEAANDIRLQRREIGQRVKTLRRTQVGEQVHFLAQAQQATLGLQAEIQIVILRAADSSQKDGIHLLRLFHRGVGQRHTVFVIGSTPDKILADIKGQITIGTEPINHLADFGHNFGADAVAGQDKKRGVAHVETLRNLSSGA